MKLIKLAFVAFMISIVTPSVQALSYEQLLLEDVQKKLGVNENIAKAFLQYVRDFVSESQNNFSLIASKDTSPEEKKALITRMLENYFEDPMNSEIQVLNLNIKTYPVAVYLYRLSKLNYDRIKLYFNPNYFSMGPLTRYTDPFSGKYGYDFHVRLWQTIEICNRKIVKIINEFDVKSKMICSRVYIKRTFHIVFMIAKTGWVMRIHGITTDKTTYKKPESWR